MTAAIFVQSLGLPTVPSRAALLSGAERLARAILAGARFAAEAERRHRAIRRLQALDDAALAARGLAREEIVRAVYWLEFLD